MKCTPQEEAALRARFEEAFKLSADGNADLFGRQLGYLNGGYVRQVVSGEKPVRQAIIERVHAIKGGAFEGWFNGYVPWARVNSAPVMDVRRFSLPGLELAAAFDRLPDVPKKLQVYTALLDEFRRLAIELAPQPAAAPQTRALETGPRHALPRRQ